jgi:hypothetical protein
MLDEFLANKIQSVIENFLIEKDIRFSLNTEIDKKIISISFNMEIGIVNTHFVIHQPIKIVEVLAYLPIRVPVEKRLEVSKFLDMIGQTFFVGNYQLNHEDGQIRCKSYFIYDENELSNTLIDMHLSATYLLANSSYSDIMKICFGNKNAETVYYDSMNKINTKNN